MRTNPVDLFIKTLIVSGMVLPLIFDGCGKKNPIPPDTNSPPASSVTVTPPSGDAPLKTHVAISGTDPDNNIVKYSLKIGDNAYNRTAPFLKLMGQPE